MLILCHPLSNVGALEQWTKKVTIQEVSFHPFNTLKENPFEQPYNDNFEIDQNDLKDHFTETEDRHVQQFSIKPSIKIQGFKDRSYSTEDDTKPILKPSESQHVSAITGIDLLPQSSSMYLMTLSYLNHI